MVNIMFQPEKALKRAEELLTVGQKNDALLILHGVGSNNKIKVWQPGFEPLMLKHVELSVELKKGRLAKEALRQYKSISQNNIESLEKVIKKFLELSESRVEQAREKSELKAIDIEDLEASETPESIMMSTVTDEDTKDRTDREILTPWLKFLWETYRTVLDVLRNNSKAEVLYQNTAQNAFKFCLKYARKTEFRRLCEILRTHLSSLPKYSHQLNAISLNTGDSLQMHFDTRFVQLNTGTQLELWQEAFKTIEDIHGLMQMSKKVLKPAAISEYYEKLTQIFLVSENYLMHAFSFRRFYTISKQMNKNIPPEEKKRLASLVLLAALAVPVVSTTRGQYGFLDADEQHARNMKLAALIGHSRLPTRDVLLKDLMSKDFSEQVISEVKSLYKILELDFNPMVLCQKVTPILDFLQKDPKFAVYVSAIKDVVITRLLQQLGEVYKTIKLKSVTDLVPFIDSLTVEKFIVEGCKRGDFQVRINHADQTITFGVTSLTAASTDEALGGAHLQTIEIRSQVSRLSKKLHEAVELIDPASLKQKVEERTKAFSAISADLEKEHMLTLARRVTIEQRKVQTEALIQDKERKERQERIQREREEAEAEKARLTEESKKRDQEQNARVRAEIEKQQRLKAAQDLKKKSEQIGIKLNIEDLESMAPEALLAKQVEQLEKEKSELKQRMNTLAKKLDHTERAMRQEEISFLEQDYETQKKIDREHHEKLYEQTVAASKAKHAKDLQMKNKLSKMREDAEAYKKTLFQQREQEHQRKVQEAKRLMEAEKAKRREREAEARKEREIQEALEAKKREREQRERELEAERKAAAERERERERDSFRERDRDRDRDRDSFRDRDRDRDRDSFRDRDNRGDSYNRDNRDNRDSYNRDRDNRDNRDRAPPSRDSGAPPRDSGASLPKSKYVPPGARRDGGGGGGSSASSGRW